VRRTGRLAACLAALVLGGPAGATPVFPADEGAHPEFRTEWWYVTGWVATANGAPLGFQVTFFRSHPAGAAGNPSAFAASQVLIAHAALADPAHGGAWHAERIARAGFGLAAAATGHTEVHIRDWRLAAAGGAYVATLPAEQFSLALTLAPTAPPLLHGREGLSQKGPGSGATSWYYSLPQLAVSGSVTRAGRTMAVTGRAWLDHEWSNAYLDGESVGWDWIGLNLEDGAALMAFRMRDRTGAQRWAGGTLREAGGKVHVLAPGEVEFEPQRQWRSPRTGIVWPVVFRVRAGALGFSLTPLLDDQESDSRLTTGAVYWEGAVSALAGGRRIGRGYLELTGYGEPLRLP
jgi:predicted secreted hydrolase